MERARVGGANALLGTFLTSGSRFDRVLEGLVITSIGSGKATCELTVGEPHTNSYGTLHGGCIATIVDIVGTMAAMSIDPLRPGVSVDMSQTFLSPAKQGSRLLIQGSCLRSGRRLAFTEVSISLLEAPHTLVATGRHTKAL
jgi:acyl-coenzyme A thioesterase 13